MWWAAVVSALHVIALGIGLGSAFARWRALRQADVAAVLYADNLYGLAALLWIGTGLVRLLGTTGKGTAWYLASPWFVLKMALFFTAMLIELWPMVTFIRWRIALGRGGEADLRHTVWLARLTAIEVAILLVIPFVAALMARGVPL